MEINRKPRTGDVKITENVDFSGLLLSDPVLTGLKQAGFTRPSPIQLKAIPLGRCGLDLVVQAKSGTGKTCVFSVVALESIALDAASTQALVLAPTREIAVQIWEVINSLGSGMSGLRCYTFIGGMPLADDKVKLKKCHIAVGTPGRVKQLIEQQALNTESIRLFILDEADKLMEEGFQETINWIYSSLPQNKQMLALSATFPEVLAQHLTAYMRNPTFVRLNTTDPALLGIRQYYKQVPFHPLPQKAFEAKCQALMCLLSEVVFQQCLVFSNYQLRAQSLSDILNAKGWPATYISGSQDQQDRLIAMAKLKKFKCRILISTDLTSRGIDAENVNLVVNLDIPYDHETYLHRIGRAGRFGTYGAAVSFVALGKETASLSAIEKKANTKISVLPEPVPSDLAKSSGFVNIDDLVTTQPLHQVTADISSSEPKEDTGNVAEPQTHHQIQELNGTPSSTDGVECTRDTDETIPHLIDCISENVQICYAEAESLLDGPLASDATLDTLHQEYTTNGMCKIIADGNSDISTVCFSHPEDTESLKGTKASLQKPQPEDISGDHACVNGKSSGKSDVETDKNSKLVKVLQAKIPTKHMAQKLPSIELPALGCSDTKRSQHLTYKALMADLKHFRETGQLLHDISTPPSTAENVVLTNESFNQVVEDIAKFLKVLHVDPVKETIPSTPKTAGQTQAMPSIISTDISKNVQSFKLGTPALSEDVSSEDNLKVKVDQGGQNGKDCHVSHAKGSQGRNNGGARPKDRRKFKHSTINVQPSVNSTSKGKTTREDHLLGLDYMKKLTACLDRNSSDDSETTDDSRGESVSGSSCSDREQLFEDGDEEYSTDGDYHQDKNFAPTRHQAETYRNSQWVPVSTENVANHGAENDDCEQYYSQDPQLTDGIDGYQSHWEYADRGEMEWDLPESHEPQHENSTSYQQFGHMHNSLYPHDLWLQCQTLLGSINAAQATQYAWFCEQQHMYHSSYAQYYADMYLRHHTLPRGTNVPKKNYSHRKYKGDFNG